ncbi:uncharacterized protein SPSK_02714 [Sporothrix schenckii 1099-18]|uniref:DUF427 domain-containing protein n=2 Tax=Sporothrix schenckii TaxID=29908 RepID=U7PQA0_SPOS1|nr:uncharacterized protein SPSK_02714 [Sporothrix schenckii 1099-18]ERS96884.1 hypothetical protein HMPREF1624_06210 [Sporothrix schenckii ATCC 58251]KJR86069.1 hypothetical protein SPSK_02714 [Sporothrix schenckii 1099-18]
MADASSLATNGPIKQEPTNRRVRALLGGQWIFDTLDAVYVWEHKYYPVYYVPVAAVLAGPGKLDKNDGPTDNGVVLATLQSNSTTATVTIFEAGPLAGLAKVASETLEWYAEDEKLLGSHPKDPYTRIECLPSSRPVRIELGGTVLAESHNSIFLHETNLRTRYYLSPTSVKDWSVLKPSETTSFCPYKGQARYYHVVLPDGREVKDGVWYYPFPTLESALIQSRLSFYNEKFDVFVDGVKE